MAILATKADSIDRSALCVCKYPLLIIDNREGEVIYYSMPIAILGREMSVPKMDLVEEIGFDGIKQEYEMVEWQKPHGRLNRYNVHNHIVLAGCPESELACSIKNIFVVYHPIQEWRSWHIQYLE